MTSTRGPGPRPAWVRHRARPAGTAGLGLRHRPQHQPQRRRGWQVMALVRLHAAGLVSPGPLSRPWGISCLAVPTGRSAMPTEPSRSGAVRGWRPWACQPDLPGWPVPPLPWRRSPPLRRPPEFRPGPLEILQGHACTRRPGPVPGGGPSGALQYHHPGLPGLKQERRAWPGPEARRHHFPLRWAGLHGPEPPDPGSLLRYLRSTPSARIPVRRAPAGDPPPPQRPC